MKRMVLLLAVTALLMVSLAVPAFADAGGNSDAAHFCHELAAWFGITHGECTSYFAQL